jgi:hypothetical protein
LALSPRPSVNSNAAAKDRFAALPAGEQDNADDDRRRDQPVGQHAGPALTLPVAGCQTTSPRVQMRSSAVMAFEKRLWRQSINPIAPRKFPTGCKSALKVCCTAFFSLARNPAPMRSRSTVAIRAECANVECQHRIVWQGCQR